MNEERIKELEKQNEQLQARVAQLEEFSTLCREHGYYVGIEEVQSAAKLLFAQSPSDWLAKHDAEKDALIAKLQRQVDDMLKLQEVSERRHGREIAMAEQRAKAVPDSYTLTTIDGTKIISRVGDVCIGQGATTTNPANLRICERGTHGCIVVHDAPQPERSE